MAKRLWTNYNTSQANATEQLFTFTTPDDYRTRHVKSIFCSVNSAGVQISIYAAGQEYSTVDASRFAAGDAILELEFDLPAKIQPTIGIKDLGSSAHTNFAITIGYEVDAGSGP